MSEHPFAVVLDLDGTLVDSVYHHVVAWGGALTDAGYDVPLWRIHTAVGMGSDRLLPWLLGEHVKEAGELSSDHKRRFLDFTDRLRPTRGAHALLDDLDERGVTYRIATSAGSEEREALLAALGRDVPHTDSGEVDASKPAPDLMLATCGALGVEPGHAVMVGDSPWDAESARRLGAQAVAVRCGGFADHLLLAAGATTLVDDPRELIGRL